MGMMHTDCYAKKTSHPAKRYRVKYAQPCEAGAECLHGGTMSRGEECCFTRSRDRGESTATPPAAPPATSATTALPAMPAVQSSDPVAGALASILLPLVASRVDSAVDARLAKVDPDAIVAQCEAAVSEMLAAVRIPQEIVIKRPEHAPVNVGTQHRMFPTLLSCISSGVNTWLYGPAGTGKTTAVMRAADALGLTFRYTGSVSSAFEISGYMSSSGSYVRTNARDAYEHGGVLLLDECDGSDANALLWANAMIENGVCAFPDGMVKRHPEFVLVAAGNTLGLGADKQFVGRNRLDGAFLSRFPAKLEWPIDETLESGTCANAEWVRRVQSVRKVCASRGLQVAVTPRLTYGGARMLAQGMPQDIVESLTFGGIMTPEQWVQVRGAS